MSVYTLITLLYTLITLLYTLITLLYTLITLLYTLITLLYTLIILLYTLITLLYTLITLLYTLIILLSHSYHTPDLTKLPIGITIKRLFRQITRSIQSPIAFLKYACTGLGSSTKCVTMSLRVTSCGELLIKVVGGVAGITRRGGRLL